MSTATRMRAILKDGATDIRLLMTHPMESGLRKDATGQLVPQRFITDVHATLNGRTVLSAKWSFAVSQDPFLWFRVQGAKPGDKLAVEWRDSTGDHRSDELVLG